MDLFDNYSQQVDMQEEDLEAPARRTKFIDDLVLEGGPGKVVFLRYTPDIRLAVKAMEAGADITTATSKVAGMLTVPQPAEAMASTLLAIATAHDIPPALVGRLADVVRDFFEHRGVTDDAVVSGPEANSLLADEGLGPWAEGP